MSDRVFRWVVGVFVVSFLLGVLLWAFVLTPPVLVNP